MSKHRSARIFVKLRTLNKILLARAQYVLGRFSVFKFAMNIFSTIAVSIVCRGLDWKSLVRWWKAVDLSFCLTFPSRNEKHAGSWRIGKEKKI